MYDVLRKFGERIVYGFGFGLGMGTSWKFFPVKKNPSDFSPRAKKSDGFLSSPRIKKCDSNGVY